MTKKPAAKRKAPAKKIVKMAPTKQAMGELQKLYDLYNKTLFKGELPDCLITVYNKGPRSYGHYAPKRFALIEDNEVRTDEICMNPRFFMHQNPMEFGQTMAHEMCHLWQQHFGKPSRSAYHNAEWAEKMVSIGLMPSDTGQPGGKMTGQKMADYVIEGGRFEEVTKKLLASGFKLSWYEAGAPIEEKPSKPEAAPAEDGEEGDGESETTSGKRRKFTCPDCSANAYGKGSLKLICGEWLVPFA